MRHKRNYPGLRRYHHRWKGRKPIPHAVQHIFDKTCFVYLSQTTDQDEAYKEFLDWVAVWEKQIEQAKLSLIRDALAETFKLRVQFDRQVADLKKRLATPTTLEKISEVITTLFDRHGVGLEHIVQAQGRVEEAFAAAPKPVEAVQEYQEVVPPPAKRGGHTSLLAFLKDFEEWCVETNQYQPAKPGKPSRMRRIIALIQQFEAAMEHPSIEQMIAEDGYKFAQGWIAKLAARKRDGRPMGHKSIKRMVGDCNVYWRYLGRFSKGGVKRVTRTGGPFGSLDYTGHGAPPTKVDPYTPDILVRLIDRLYLEAAKPANHVRAGFRGGSETESDVLLEAAYALWVAMYTGMRIESVSSILVSEVRTASVEELAASIPWVRVDTTGWEPIQYLYIPKDKTDSGEREIPFHPHIIPLINHLVAQAKQRGDNRLFRFAGTDNGRWRDRIRAVLIELNIATRNEEKRTKISTFHSLRHLFDVAVLLIDCKLWVQKRLMGHKDTDQSTGEGESKYGVTPPLRWLQNAVVQIDYPGLSPWTLPNLPELEQRGRELPDLKLALRRSVRAQSTQSEP